MSVAWGRCRVEGAVLWLALIAGWTGFSSQASAQDYSLSKTANPTTYSAAGQIITYTYVLRNISGYSEPDYQITDNKLGVIPCPVVLIPQGGSTTCTATYTTTAADLAGGNIVNTAIARVSQPEVNDQFPSAQATVTLVPQPSWTLAKAASPTTYTAAGQTIAYSYLLTNTGNTVINAIALTDNKIGTVNCPGTTLGIGGSMACSASYIITAADASAASVVNIATATGVPTAGTLSPATAQATIIRALVPTPTPPPPPTTGSITIVKAASGGNNTFNFTSTIGGTASFTLTTSGGTATRSFTGLSAGTYTFTEVNLPLNWRLSSLTCSGDTGGRPTTTALTAHSVSIGLDGGESITCTFSNVFDTGLHIFRTQTVIERFLARRVSLLASEEPDRTRFIRRLPGTLFGEGGTSGSFAPPNQPFNVTGTTYGLSTQMSFSTSLSQAMAYAEAQDTNRLSVAGKRNPAASSPSRFDVWVEGHFNRYSADLSGPNNRGHFNIIYVGADYLITNAVLVGALVQFDWTGETSATLQNSVNGSGVMGGPYLSARLTQNLYFDMRVAWGTSDNSVNPFGLYTDKFTTDRWLAHAKLTGNWTWGSFRLTPSAGVTFVQENQKNYVDSLGILIPDQTVTLGRFALGPEFAYRIMGAGGTIYEPYVELKGTWDFIKPGGTTIVGNYIVSNDDLRAQVKGGIMARWANGYTLRVAGQYDGIGSNSLRNYGGQFWLNIPFEIPR